MARKEEVEEGERDKMKRSEKREVAKMMESVALVLSFAAVGEEMLMAEGDDGGCGICIFILFLKPNFLGWCCVCFRGEEES